MAALLRVSRAIDGLNTVVGRVAMWLILAAILISTGNALARKFLSISSNSWLEIQWYLFGAVFMLCAPYTLLKNEHIRIDIINGRLSHRTRNIIDIIGHVLFLMPFAVLFLIDTWPFFMTSYRSGEVSPSAGGLIIWPAKLSILVGFFLLFLQGISELVKRIAIMRGDLEDSAEHKDEADA
jgi:TRAP-type mannitol/chloroaromatic compound transport system permease small subunit